MEEQKENSRIVKTDEGAKDGQNKCPKCGATDISVNTKTGLLRCNYCRTEFAAQEIEGLETDISKLQGEVMGSGAQDIENNVEQNVITLKCSSCGSEVVIDTAETTNARCHWCRNTLSINEQVPNGSVPDAVLPFKLPKEEAKKQIEEFVGKRKFFAHPTFKKEFTTENVMGVYFPYMIVDINAHAAFAGKGEHEVRRYTRGTKENRRTYYDADLYEVEREFDLTIKGLTVETSADKLNRNDSSKTTNIINSIMPFDIENCAKWDSNYLKGYTSEKRDVNIDNIRSLVDEQAKDIARFDANKTLQQYDRGVRWENENLNVKGKQWKSAYLPVWLYSYQQKKGDKSILHYVAVNARTKETMGSVPIHMPKLFAISAMVELIGGLLVLLLEEFKYKWLFLLVGIIYFFVIKGKYRNSSARHYHEKETESNMTDIRKEDRLIKRETGLSNSRINGANNTRVNGNNIKPDILEQLQNNM